VRKKSAMDNYKPMTSHEVSPCVFWTLSSSGKTGKAHCFACEWYSDTIDFLRALLGVDTASDSFSARCTCCPCALGLPFAVMGWRRTNTRAPQGWHPWGLFFTVLPTEQEKGQRQ
jgi:hypothetical protein